MSQICKLVGAIIWILVTITYYIYTSIELQAIYESKNCTKYIQPNCTKYIQPKFNESDGFLIKTPGCRILNYGKTLKFTDAPLHKQTCGERAVFVERAGEDKIMFIIDDKKLNKHIQKNKGYECCYRFARRSDVDGAENKQLIYTTCNPIENATTIDLLHEVVTVKCEDNQQKTIYEDAYIELKKLRQRETIKHKNAWNVLLLGLDTMSRARAQYSLPRTVQFLKDHNWLDYRGYQKVASNTFPNLMAFLAGMNSSEAYSKCQINIEACNDMMMWSKFRKAGYITAYGEDYLRLPDTFASPKSKGFKNPPTDHYMRPFFLTGEMQAGNYNCASKKTSVHDMLYYASEFANTYKDEGFFGLFWINSCSHNSDNLPRLCDGDLLSFFDKMNETGVFENTFVIFISDHGIRYGKTRQEKGSFFEERLPMLFIWVPLEFRQLFSKAFQNLILNQARLVTPYDLYLTLGNILQISRTDLDTSRPEGCIQCSSLFEEISPNRKCQDVSVDEKWCTCHGAMVDTMQNDTGGSYSLKIAVEYMQNRTKHVKTMPCTECSDLKLKKVLRNQWYYNEFNNATYYIIAFSMSPGDVAYEVTVEKNGEKYTILGPSEQITSYNVRGNCVINPNDRAYCVCENVKCKKL